MTDLNEMVAVVNNWFQKDTPENKKIFLKTPKNKLFQYNTILGRSIRNEFKLWETEWEPQIKDGVDYSPMHPDAISLTVIERVWELNQNEN